MKTYIKKSIEAIKEHLEGLSSSEQVSIHNEYCRESNDSDNEIYNNDDEFFNTFFDNRVIEAVRAVAYGEYNYTDEYVKFNGYGNLESFNNPDEYIDLDEIAEDILNNPDHYYDIELEEDEEEEETEDNKI